MDFFSKALQLQHTRCRVYQLWDTKFFLAVSGALSAESFHNIVNDTIIAGFQEVSSSLRQLQDNIRVETKGNNNNNNNNEECKGGGDALLFLDTWIDQIQRVEKEHYHTTVLLTQNIAQHTTALPLTQHDKKNKETTTGEAGEEEEEAKDGAKSTTSVATDAPRISLHDAELCSLRQLVPVKVHKFFTFVSCSDAASPSSGDDDGNEEKEEEEKETLLLSSGVVASYTPRKVWRRCAAFNEMTLPLWKRKRSLMQQLYELTEDLQAELVSLATSE